jgi:hypothetical protein
MVETKAAGRGNFHKLEYLISNHQKLIDQLPLNSTGVELDRNLQRGWQLPDCRRR